MHILLPETDNCPSWISGRERMTVENISWSISTKECCRPRRGLNPRPPGLQSDGAPKWATEVGLCIYAFGYVQMMKCQILWRHIPCMYSKNIDTQHFVCSLHQSLQLSEMFSLKKCANNWSASRKNAINLYDMIWDMEWNMSLLWNPKDKCAITLQNLQ